MRRFKILGAHNFLVAICIVALVAIINLNSAILSFLLILLLFGEAFLEIMKLLMWIGFRNKPFNKQIHLQPMVSVHLAIYNESSKIVIKTIQSVLAQHYPNYELIIVDNNTRDERKWKPVKAFCSNYGRIRFFHLRNWPFYKSGALNFARKVTSQKAEFIFVVDADYILERNALQLAIENAHSSNIALTQFPQSYDCKEKEHGAILSEFNHFFDYYCFKANSCYGALATGTLSLISIKALDDVGGWPINSITEDAELGARLQVAGYDIKYVHKIIGRGIAPIHQIDFIKQRKRWIFGNVQTLFNYTLNPLVNFKKWISGISQLTAWANLLGLPILSLVCCLILFPFSQATTLYTVSLLSYLSLWVFTISRFGQLLLVHRNKPIQAFGTFLIHFTSLDIGAFHWWPVIFAQRRPFVKTNKESKVSFYRFNIFYPLLHLGLGVVWVSANANFISFSAFTFGLLHTSASVYDCHCRNKNFRNVTPSLKFLS